MTEKGTAKKKLGLLKVQKITKQSTALLQRLTTSHGAEVM